MFDFLDTLIVKTAHCIGAFVEGVTRLWVYTQFAALVILATGVVGFVLYLAFSAALKSTFGG